MSGAPPRVAWFLASCTGRSLAMAALALAVGATVHASSAVLPQSSSSTGVVRAARVELVGPLDSAFLATSVGELKLERSLATGERLEAWVPIPADSDELARAARWRLEGPRDEGGLSLGRARSVLVLEQHPAYDELDPALVARALPKVARAAPLGGAVLAVACFASALALACAARVRQPLGAVLALAAGLGGAAGAFALRGEFEPPQAVVLEALDDTPVWLLRRASLGTLELPELDGPLRVLAPEARGALRAWSDLERHRLRGEGVLVAETPWVATLDRLAPEANAFEALTLVHQRSGGVWTAHGDWPLGAALPSAIPGAPASVPPWLLLGLPPGVEVWLGRRSDGSWLRWVGRGG